MLSSILISALTCLAMAWLPIHEVLPKPKEKTDAPTVHVTRQVP